MKLYTYKINIDNHDIEAESVDIDDYASCGQDEFVGFFNYSDERYVYAESWISEKDARTLVYKFLGKFNECYKKIQHIIRKESVAGCGCEERGEICDCYQLSYR